MALAAPGGEAVTPMWGLLRLRRGGDLNATPSAIVSSSLAYCVSSAELSTARASCEFKGTERRLGRGGVFDNGLLYWSTPPEVLSEAPSAVST